MGKGRGGLVQALGIGPPTLSWPTRGIGFGSAALAIGSFR